MPSIPPCRALGRHCRELTLTLRIADLRDDSPTLQDAAATWLLGHTERISFGTPYVDGGELLVRATVHVPCKYLEVADGQERRGWQTARCAAHGFRGRVPPSRRPAPDARPSFRRGRDRFQLFYKGRRRVLGLPLKRAAPRALPVLQEANPCVGAPCRTADNTRGAACCRDLTLEVVAPRADRNTEALLRARRSPYLCKVTRTNDATIECEVLSACGYLEDDGISCGLHDRVLPNRRLAKPSICYEWPDIGPDEVAHPGCRLV